MTNTQSLVEARTILRRAYDAINALPPDVMLEDILADLMKTRLHLIHWIEADRAVEPAE